MEPVTRWERWVVPKAEREGEPPKPPYWAHNHLEMGHAETDRPTPLDDPAGRPFPEQRHSWSHGSWRRTHGILGGARFTPTGEPVGDPPMADLDEHPQDA